MTDATPDAPPEVPAGRPPAWLLPVVLLLTLAVFWPALGGERVYDDHLMIGSNPNITSLANVPAMFTSSYWDFLDPEEASRIGYWRPLTAVCLAVGYQLGGGSDVAFHALSLVAHLAATAASFLLLLRLTRRPFVAAAAGLFFGLHPVHVESVAWMTALNDPLYGALMLFSALAFLRWRERGSSGSPVAAGVLFALALLAKEMAVAGVLVCLAIDLCRPVPPGTPLRDRFGVRAYLPFAVALLAFYLARVLVFGGLAAGLDRTTTTFGVTATRLVQLRVELVGGALQLLAWPSELQPFRGIAPELPIGDPAFALPLLWTLAFGAATVLLVVRRSYGPALFSALLFLGTFLPVLLRVQSIGQFPLAERFLYVPTLGAVAALALGLERLLPRPAAIAAVLAVAGAYAYRSSEQIPVWHDEVSLYAAALEHEPESPYVHHGLGHALLRRARETGSRADIEQALELFERSNDLTTRARDGDQSIFATTYDRLQANLGVGWSYVYLAEFDPYQDYGVPKEAFRLLVEARPTSERAHTGLGTTLYLMGDLPGAEQSLRRAIAINPNYAQARHNLGLVFLRRGAFDAARAELERALELRPDYPLSMIWLAQVESADGNQRRAIELAERARTLRPNDPIAPTLLGRFAAAESDWSTALERLDEAIAIDPEYGEAHKHRAKVLYAMQQVSEAIVTFRRACDLLPEDFEAHFNLANLLSQSGAIESATPFAERAYSVGSENRSAMTALRGYLSQVHGEDFERLFDLALLDYRREEDLATRVWLTAVLDLEPEHAGALRLRGLLERRSGNDEEAVSYLRAAAASAPESFQVHLDLGSALEAIGLTDQALEALERAEAIGPPANMDPGLRDAMVRRLERELGELRGLTGPPPPDPTAPLETSTD